MAPGLPPLRVSIRPAGSSRQRTPEMAPALPPLRVSIRPAGSSRQRTPEMAPALPPLRVSIRPAGSSRQRTPEMAPARRGWHGTPRGGTAPTGRLVPAIRGTGDHTPLVTRASRAGAVTLALQGEVDQSRDQLHVREPRGFPEPRVDAGAREASDRVDLVHEDA